MDHMLWTSERNGVMTLECVASAPGLVVDTQQTARALRQAIGRAFAGCPWTNDNIQHVSVTSSTEEAFQQARADLADQVRAESTFHLEVCCGVAARAVLNCRARGARQSARGRRGWVHADHDVAAADPALHGAAPASQRPPPDAASFAGVVTAGLPQFALSAFAAAASEKHAEIKASLQPPMERDGVLAVARACLVLLEAVIPKLARLAHFADTLSGRACLSGQGLRGRTARRFGRRLRRPGSPCTAQMRRPLASTSGDRGAGGGGARPDRLRRRCAGGGGARPDRRRRHRRRHL